MRRLVSFGKNALVDFDWTISEVIESGKLKAEKFKVVKFRFLIENERKEQLERVIELSVQEFLEFEKLAKKAITS